MTAGIAFDVDDTLYLETDYVRSGFDAVARLVAGTGAISAEQAYRFLYGCFERGVRNNTFDLLLDEAPGLRPRFEVRELVEAYRAHEPRIRLLPGIVELLESLRARGARLGLITDGALESQRRKISALGLDALVDTTVMTDQWGRDCWKPHPKAFEELGGRWNLPPDRLAYVGDNPAKDFLAPNRLRWWTVRLRLREQLRADLEPDTDEHGARATVRSVSELGKTLVEWIDRTGLG